jgi:phospholipid/cholesterol/gamma-HCH transport system permease protein
LNIEFYLQFTKDFVLILLKIVGIFFKGPYRIREIFKHAAAISYGSFPIVLVATIFAGIVVTAEIALHMNMALNTIEMVPGVMGQFIFREIGIIIPALLLVAKVGASTAAEVSTMKITEQIDALKLLQIDPVEYLVYPRFVASVFSTVCLTVFSIFITLICAAIFSKINFGVTYYEYLNNFIPFVNMVDVACALSKAAVFGGLIPIVSCLHGFSCEGGAEGVGRSTTQSVVVSTIAIVVLDFVLTYLFSLVIA